MVSWGPEVGECEMLIARVPPTAVRRVFRVVRGGHEFLDYNLPNRFAAAGSSGFG